MKIIQTALILIFSFISSSLAKEFIKDLDFKDANYVHSKHDVKYFINDGYKLVQQETKGTTTGYVLKKADKNGQHEQPGFADICGVTYHSGRVAPGP